MPINIRAADIPDIDAMADLLLQDAKERRARDGTLWKLTTDAQRKLADGLTSAMQNSAPPFRQQWLLALAEGRIVGITHSILLPVPPIYAGEFGAPGLIMEDCFVLPEAPEGTQDALLTAAEADLRQAGARILLASSVPDGAWQATLTAQDYAPLTHYFAKVGLDAPRYPPGIRGATRADVPAIVSASATHRQVLHDLHPTFWKPHAAADDRFGAWMTKSLTLPDRDMFVAEAEGRFQGYAISQPATPLHFPAAHEVTGTGFMDDFHHNALDDPITLADPHQSAADLLHAAEAARQARGDAALLVVCPAAWQSKVAVFEAAGYALAITWFIKA